VTTGHTRYDPGGTVSLLGLYTCDTRAHLDEQAALSFSYAIPRCPQLLRFRAWYSRHSPIRSLSRERGRAIWP
jgi:hypothetical protein